MSTRGPAVALIAVALCGPYSALDAEAAMEPNSLRLVRAAADVQLSWLAATPSSGVYRSESPVDLIRPEHFIDGVSGNLYIDDALPPPPGGLYFYGVGDVPPVPGCELLADPDTITAGDSSRLSWDSPGAASVKLDGVDVPPSGELVVSPASTREYVLEVWSDIGEPPEVCSATVEVTYPPCTATTPCPFWCGTGDIPDVRSGGSIRLDGPDMVHVLILAEGYTSVEIDAGNFEQDATEWILETLAIEPYTFYQNAFCVWMLPAVSTEYVADASPQTADTAFLVPISGNRVAPDMASDGPTAEPVWEVVESFPFRPRSFYPEGGVTRFTGKNLIAVILVCSSSTGHSGFSGKAVDLTNPAEPSEWASTAIAHGRPHEFSHMFSRLGDEYIEDGRGPLCWPGTAPFVSKDVTNTMCSNACADLPWTHLMVGTALNPATDGLVGAFGVDGIGFHPELKCLMNGRHDNARYFGGNGNLGLSDRFCNFCRELAAFRLHERVHLLDDPMTSWDLWASEYRQPFYQQFPFYVPDPVPQENSDGEPIFVPCAP